MDFSKTAREPLWHSACDMPSLSAGCSKRRFSKAATSEDARRTLRYVELLSEARTKLADFFSIVLGRARRRPSVIEFTREHSLARTHTQEPNGNLILGQTQPDHLLVANLLVDSASAPREPRLCETRSCGSLPPSIDRYQVARLIWSLRSILFVWFFVERN